MNRQVAALVLSIAVAVLGWLALLDRGLRPALVPILTAGGILLGLLGVVVRLSRPRSGSPEGMSATAMWRVAVTVVLFCVGLPVIFIVLASNSWSTRAVLPLFSTLSPSGRWLGLLEELLMLGVALLIVFVPDSLHARGRAARSLVPEWLAGFASVLTVAFILLLHFGGIAEANLRMAQMGVLSVVAFGVAVLLAPFYRIVAKECLQQGIAVVFDPARWWSAWCAALGEMRRAPADAAEPLADGTREPVASGTLAGSEENRT
jgi:hypothetical protein